MPRQTPATIYRAAAIRDAVGTTARPGAVAVRSGRILAASHPDRLPRRLTQKAQWIDLPGALILPAMVNAHAHLDLTAVGPIEYTGDFGQWLGQVMATRQAGRGEVAESVRHGAAMSLDAGVGWVGDIAHKPEAVAARRTCRLPGVSYLEAFGIGTKQQEGIAQLDDALKDIPYDTPIHDLARGIVVGVSPHAPYSVGPGIYDHACDLSRNRAYRVCTHLAETREEIDFVRDNAGLFRELLERFGLWDDSITPTSKHPIDFFEPFLKHSRWLIAHANYIEDHHLDLLHRTDTSVVYCPIASEYFGHTGHRYRDMLDAGVNVCLGTDSMMCQSPDAVQPMSILPVMRRLFHRDGTDPQTLLEMATVNGMRAMELSEYDATLRRGAPALLAAVDIVADDPTDPLEQVLTGDAPMRMLELPRVEP